MYLLSKEYRNLIIDKIKTAKYVELSSKKDFQDHFVSGMMFKRVFEPSKN